MSAGTDTIEPAARRLPFPFRDVTVAVVSVLAAIASLLVVLQIVVLLLTSTRTTLLFDGTASLTLANFQYVFGSRLFNPVVVNTLVLGVGSIAVMFLFAIPLAWLYARTDLPRKETLIILLTAKVAMPGFLVALGYILLFNRSNGLVNQMLKQVFGFEQSLFNVYTMPWMILLQGVAIASACFFMLVPSFMAIDSSMEESGRVSGLTQRSVVTRISIPLVVPAILASAIYFFIIAIEGFDYPAMLGLPSRTFVASTWLFLLIGSSSDVPQYGEAAALAVLMSGLGGSLSLFYFWTTRRAARYAVVTGKRRPPDPTPLSRRAKWLAWIFIGFYATLGMFLPLITLVWASINPYLRLPTAEAFSSLTIKAYYVAMNTMVASAWNSIILMVGTATVSVLFGLAVSWVVNRTQVPGRKILDFMVMAAVAIPATVVGLAFLFLGIWTYKIIPIYSTIWLVVLALGVRQTTWAHRAISSATLQVHRELEEAGSVSGVRRGRVLTSILVPIIRPAILFSWFWIALLALRELAIPLMLLTPETKLLSTAIYAFNNSGNAAVASAVGVMMIFVIGIMVLVFHHFAGKRMI